MIARSELFVVVVGVVAAAAAAAVYELSER